MSHHNQLAMVVGRGSLSNEHEGQPPLMNLHYTYPYTFGTVANAYFKKFNWENRTSLSTIASVEQVDDDTLVYYRR